MLALFYKCSLKPCLGLCAQVQLWLVTCCVYQDTEPKLRLRKTEENIPIPAPHVSSLMQKCKAWIISGGQS